MLGLNQEFHKAIITGRDDALLDTFLCIPSEIDGYPVTEIGDVAFKDITPGIGKVLWLPDTIERIGAEAFAANPWIYSVIHMPSNLTSMGRGVFGGCIYLDHVKLPDSLTEIPEQAFASCFSLGVDGLKGIMGSNITRIGNAAFVNCYYLCQRVEDQSGERLPENLVYIGDNAFGGCKYIKRLTIPAGVTQISNGAFQACTSLTEIVFEGQIERIGAFAFDGCTALNQIDLGDALTSIGTSAFKGCTSLEHINIGSQVSSIGVDAFRECLNLEGFTVDADNSDYTAYYGALMTADHEHLLTYAPKSPYETFEAPAALRTVDDGAFNHVRYMKTLILPEGFSDYRDEMFLDATGIEYISFPEGSLATIPDRFLKGCTSFIQPNEYVGIVSVGKEAFMGCSSLTSIMFDDALNSVDDQAFRDCSSLTAAVFRDSTQNWGVGVFRNAASLQGFTLPASMTSIPQFMFNGCSNLEYVIWNAPIETVGSSAFENSGIQSVVFPQSVTIIYSQAFLGCASLESAVLPDTLQQIGASAFEGTKLSSVVLGSGLTYLGNAAFKNCEELTSLDWDACLLDRIPLSCFESCVNLTFESLPGIIRVIDNRAFFGCTGLTHVTIPQTIEWIGDKAFAGCTGLIDLLIYPATVNIASNAFADCGSLTVRGWNGSAAQTAAQTSGVLFESCDAALTYVLNDVSDAYLVSSYDPEAFNRVYTRTIRRFACGRAGGRRVRTVS